MNPSISEKLRLQGNESFQASKYLEAINFYNRALRVCDVSEKNEQSSIFKNLAASFAKLNQKENNFKTKQENLEKIIQYFISAYLTGNNCKSNEWLSKIELDMLAAIRIFESEENKTKIKIYFFCLSLIPDDLTFVKTIVSLSLSRKNFNEAIKNIEVSNFKEALYHIHEMKGPLLISEHILSKTKIPIKKKEDLQEEIIDLQESMLNAEFRANSLQKYFIAKALYTQTIYENEEIDIEQVYNIIDLYKESISYGGGKDLELEGKSLSSLGKIFYLILKNIEKASSYFRTAISYGLALRPKIVDQKKWFKEAEKYLKEIQEKKNQSEDEIKNKEREKLKELYKDQLEELNIKSGENVEGFMNFIVSKYPNEETDKLKEEIEQNFQNQSAKNKGEKKKLILKLIRCYHPDKLKGVEDPKKKFMFEEIVRRLTNKI